MHPQKCCLRSIRVMYLTRQGKMVQLLTDSYKKTLLKKKRSIKMEYNYAQKRHTLKKAIDLSDWLIQYYKIQPGYGLSRYLGITSTSHNYEAVRMWVQSQMLVLPRHYNTVGELRRAFESLLPEEAFS